MTCLLLKATILSSSLVPTESGGEDCGDLSSPFDFRLQKWFPEVGLVVGFLSFSLLLRPLLDVCPPQAHCIVLAIPPQYPGHSVLWAPWGAGHCHGLERAIRKLHHELCRVLEASLSGASELHWKET